VLPHREATVLAKTYQQARQRVRVAVLGSPTGVARLAALAAELRSGLIHPGRVFDCPDDREEAAESAEILCAEMLGAPGSDGAIEIPTTLDLSEVTKLPISDAVVQSIASEIIRRAARAEVLTSRIRSLRSRGPGSSAARRSLRAELRKIEASTRMRARDLLELGTAIDEDRRTMLRAQSALASANLRLVIWLARRYANRGLDFDDLVQEGNLGLLRAVEKFDPDRGYKFGSYAAWWIQQSMARALSNQSRTIRIPAYMNERLMQVRKTAARVAHVLGRSPSRAELSKALQLPEDRLADVLLLPQRAMSMQRPVGDQETGELCDLFADEKRPSPRDALIAAELARNVRGVLAELPARERRILRLRFGLDDRRPRTLQAIATLFGVSRERIRQVEKRALEMLRDSASCAPLQEYLERGYVELERSMEPS